MGSTKNLIGKNFGKLTVVNYKGSLERGGAKWECACSCGKLLVVTASNLNTGNTKSCGCFKKEKATKHGMWGTLAYTVWSNMIQRCTNTKSQVWDYYGGRGITVCTRWLKFENFFEDMGQPPEGLEIDRIDNYGNYEPDNCRWTDRSTQMNNTRVQY